MAEKKIRVGIQEGMEGPEVQISEGDALEIEVGEGAEVEGYTLGTSRVALGNLRVRVHNQSYGLIDASTGCASEPGGPSC